MRRYVSVVLAMILLAVLAACGQQAESRTGPASEPTDSQPPTATSADRPAAVVEFSDKRLEGAVRDVMSKPSGDITVEEAAAVTSLNLGNDSFDDMNSKDGGVKDISALEYFTGLTELNIAFNSVSDLAPLSKLTNLETLDISGTLVEDLSPLKDLENMKCLMACWLHGDNGVPKGIGHLDALAGLKNLQMIDAKNAGITDVSGLSGLPKLWEVQLNDNQIADVSPLAKVKTLKTLLLEGNPATDYSSLKGVYAQLEGKDFEIK